jgi:phage-related protein
MKAGNFDAVHTKPLKGKVRELIIGRHRISYFLIGNVLYFVRGFPKKSAKTPKQEIEYAMQVYKLMK